LEVQFNTNHHHPAEVRRVQKNPGYLKKAQPTGFLGFIRFWALLEFSDFLFVQAVGKLIG